MTINSRFQFQEEQSGEPIQTSEQLVELNYAFRLTPSLFFRPGVQYEIRPRDIDASEHLTGPR